MENLNHYLEKLKYVSYFFDKTLVSTDEKSVKIGNKFIFQLVLEMCNNTILQKQVLSKIKEYTRHITMYLSGVQLKSKYFDDIVRIYHNYIIDSLVDSKNDEQPITTGFIINFTFHNDKFSWEPSEIWANEIVMETDGTLIELDEAGTLYHSDSILLKSIVGYETIQKYGIDGFLALLIIFLKEDDLSGKNNVESLLTICQKNLATKFNEMCTDTKHIIYDDLVANRDIDYNDLIRKIKPKESIRKWIIFLESIFHLPDSVIKESAKYMREEIQMVLFKEVRYRDDLVVTNYDTDFNDIINGLILDDPNNKELLENIKIIFKIKEIKEWHTFLEKVVLMDDSFIIKFLSNIDSKFASVFLNIYVSRDHFFCLKLKSKKQFELVKGNLYDRYMEIYNVGSVKLSHVNWYYDKDLNCIGYKLVEYNNDYSVITTYFDQNNNIMDENALHDIWQLDD
ncbi:tryptophan synthase beta chain 1-like isoform X1 [Tupanvirus soda lake]|uniref:Tryptophan synthase beta chain 1-like isoform X1 n=2 Tax=Tupanvirus TaxID=2094720 RepID=A0A6N1NJE7_9VIRU|nr:tryptophan synthase beta chain 1-like isoform X1 [Tupanvirus soda lake]QKU34959.1 tryptophan synthase beta chain 1-like isoform X1 [Tupanvirus soda lake]